MFIGVFTTMLALGALTPQRAEAQTTANLTSLTLTEQATVTTVPADAFTVSTTPIALTDGDG